MAKLISAFNSSTTSSSSSSFKNDSNNCCDIKLTNRQIPIVIDNTLTMIMEIDDLSSINNKCACLNLINSNYIHNNINKNSYDTFLNKFKQFELSKLKVKQTELNIYLSQLIACIGCRTSVERLYKSLLSYNSDTLLTSSSSSSSSSNDTINYRQSLDPLCINENGYLTVKEKFKQNPKLLYSLFSQSEPKLNALIQSIQINKKNRRCAIHTLDHSLNNKYNRSIIDLNLDDLWLQMSHTSLKQVLIIHTDQLTQTMDSYLKKYRFCSDCKNKVLKAFNLLIQSPHSLSLPSQSTLTSKSSDTPLDCVSKEFIPELYEGITCCNSKHIHLKQDKTFIETLILKAETEIQGSRRERHAKTIDIAQEEVLTCIGIYMYERFNRISQQVKLEEQLWQLMFYIGVYSLNKCFESFTNENSLDSLIKQFETKKIDKKKKSPLSGSKSKKSCFKLINKEQNLIDDKHARLCIMNDSSVIATTTTTTHTPPLSPGLPLNCKSSSTTLSSLNDAGYSSGHELVSNCCDLSCCSSLLLLSSSSSTTSSTNDCVSPKEEDEEELIIDEEQEHVILNHDQNDTINDETNDRTNCVCDLINYSRLIEESSLCDEEDIVDDCDLITDEEKREYFENRNVYLKERTKQRIQLKEKLLNLEHINIRPRMTK